MFGNVAKRLNILFDLVLMIHCKFKNTWLCEKSQGAIASEPPPTPQPQAFVAHRARTPDPFHYSTQLYGTSSNNGYLRN